MLPTAHKDASASQPGSAAASSPRTSGQLPTKAATAAVTTTATSTRLSHDNLTG
jgi:hypothetical protein